MKAALDKAADRYLTDIRSLMREKKVQYSGIAREGQNVVVRFRDARERDKANVEISQAFPDLVAREVDAGGDFKLIGEPEARGAEAHPGRRRAAEHHDPAQPGQRAGRRRADRPAAGRRPRRRAACRACRTRRAPRTSSAAPRRSKSAWSTRIPARCRTALAGQVPLGDELYTERNGVPEPRSPPGRADRRPHHRRATGLRQTAPTNPSSRHPRRRRRPNLQRDHARERRQAAWRSCWSRRTRPK